MSTYDFDKLRAKATRLITKFGDEITVTNKSYIYDEFGNKDTSTDETFLVQGVFTDTHNILIQSELNMVIDTYSTITIDGIDYSIKTIDKTAPDNEVIIWEAELHDLDVVKK